MAAPAAADVVRDVCSAIQPNAADGARRGSALPGLRIQADHGRSDAALARHVRALEELLYGCLTSRTSFVRHSAAIITVALKRGLLG